MGPECKAALIFDAVDFGLAPATLKLVRDEDVPRFMGAKKMSMHQAGFQEVLSSAELSGELPDRLALIGVQPELLNDYGGSLTACVSAQVEPAVAMACDVLAEWGVAVQRRSGPLVEADLVGPGALEIRKYEEGRPVFPGDSQ